MDILTRDYPAANIRVSDADRDAALAELSEHFQAGRLTSEELDERTGRALGARTGQDLATIMADLPATGATQSPRQGGCSSAGFWIPIAAIVIVATVGLSLAGHDGGAGLGLLIPIGLLARRLARRGRCQVSADQQRRP